VAPGTSNTTPTRGDASTPKIAPGEPHAREEAERGSKLRAVHVLLEHHRAAEPLVGEDGDRADEQPGDREQTEVGRHEQPSEDHRRDEREGLAGGVVEHGPRHGSGRLAGEAAFADQSFDRGAGLVRRH